MGTVSAGISEKQYAIFDDGPKKMQYLQVLLAFALLAVLPIVRAIRGKFARRRALCNVRGPQSRSFATGNAVDLFNPSSLPLHRMNASLYGRIVKFNWIFGEPALFVADPKALSHILIKDKELYEECDVTGTRHLQYFMFGPGLLATIGHRHRRQRKMLNPVFSTAHIRSLTPLVQSLTFQLRGILLKEVSGDKQEVELAEKLGHLAFELIAQAGFSRSYRALEDGQSHSYVRALKELPPAATKIGTMSLLAIALGIPNLPHGLLRFIGRLLPYRDLHYTMDLIQTLYSTAQGIFRDKKSVLGSVDSDKQDSEKRKDLITILLENNSTASEEDRLADEEVVAQITSLMFAGTDTTSSAMTRVLYLLATHPDAQDRLREELIEAHWGELDYDRLMSLPYLDAICRETLRLFTPVPYRTRRSTTDIILPLQDPIIGVDGKEMREILVPKDVNLFVDLNGVNTDPTIWGHDAFEWKPERWLSPLPSSVTDARIPSVYSHSATFLAGQKACLGFKFSELEMKAILSILIPTFRLTPPDKEIVFRWGPIISPTVKGRETEPGSRLPMLLSKV
ncbi:cytochrome P450 [Vararia minispora EC-137]|uniref:Cytochrome P450 n=1 Tax=Vararia minispora EC-137 TaxID=1314806 RepID=A0ACB8QV84_9AGAM|nr:cytochrome P450 [Vararia minispora EC-137]